MTLVRGATILDLISQVPASAQGFIPAEIARFIDLLNVAELRTRSSGAFFVHEGRVQSASEAGLPIGPDFPVEIPGLNVGVPFQLGWTRPDPPAGANEVEGEPTGWVLDIFLDRVAVVIPFGRPGEVIPSSPAAPAMMRRGTGERVRLYARGVLRVEGGAGGTRVRLVAEPDPIVPTAAIGAVIETGFSPPHLLLHDSGFGITVDRVVLDLTDAFTPPAIIARGHAADFEGMTIREATLYFPRNIPFVGDINAGVRDLLVGWSPRQAFQGAAHLELGVPLGSAQTLHFFQEVNGQAIALGGPAGTGRALTVTVHPSTGPSARLFARLGSPGVRAEFRLPDGRAVTGTDSEWFEVELRDDAPPLVVLERRTEVATVQVGPPTAGSGNTGAGALTVSSAPGDFQGSHARQYTLTVLASTATTVSFSWTATGEDGAGDGSTANLANAEAASLDQGIRITVAMGATPFAVGDTFQFSVTPPPFVQTQERTFSFVRSTGSSGHPPQLRVRYSPGSSTLDFDEVVFLRGPGLAMDFVSFSAIEPVGFTDQDRQGLRWLWEKEGSTRTGSGVDFDLDTGWSQGTHTVTLTDRHGKIRRCRIEVVDQGPLFVGHRSGGVRMVVGANNLAARLRAVENTWNLGAFHARDARQQAGEPATLVADALTVPKGALAEVTVQLGDDPAPVVTPPVSTTPASRHIKVRMAFDLPEAGQTNTVVFHGHRTVAPLAASGNVYGEPDASRESRAGFTATQSRSAIVAALRAWVDTMPPDTDYVVIGRCCDLGTETRNRTLAKDRAAVGRDLLIEAGVDAAHIRQIGEQGDTSGDEADYLDRISFAPASAQIDAPLVAHVDEDWKIKRDFPASTLSSWGESQDRDERKDARGVDIYAQTPAAAPVVEPDDPIQPTFLRALVPGEDTTVTTPLEPRSVQTPYRVELKAVWDSPSIVNDIDWVPTLAQVTVEWASTAVAVPGLADPVQPTRPGTNPGPDLWRVIGRFTTDQRSGQTSYLLSIDSMGDADGLFAIVNGGSGRADEAVAVGLALAPALLGGITSDDPAGAGVRVAALIAASAAAAAVQIDSKHLIEEGKVIVEKIEGEVRLRAIDATEGMKVRLSVDYTASFGVKADLAGAVGVSTLKPIKVTYKNVGLEYVHDESKPVLERLRFIFEDAKFEVADPGRWQITGALGKLLGITAIRVGAGSVWVEVDLEFAIDLGVVKISRTTIRVEVDTDQSPPAISVSLRGITAKIDVPSTLKGAGALQVLPDGFSANLELDVIPAKLKAWGAFALREKNQVYMVHVAGGVKFATGLPLGSTGLGLFGFAGRFVANGKRDVDLTNTDIIAREVGWHAKAETSKYTPDPGQFAIGFGVYIGTLPDAGFTFNALGMLTIGFPDISVVFAIDATMLSGESKSATEDKPPPPSNALTLLGIVAVDPSSIGIAIQARYEIKKVLVLEVPIGAFFPLKSSPQGGYVRVGSDGGDGRPDRPVTVRILPEVLDLRATAFFMVEERHLRKLGKRDSLNFEGFSIGFGAGVSVKWGGGSIYLKVSISILVGLGTRPFVLAGGIYVQGELRLVIIGISVSGELEAMITDKGSQLKGEFCGKIDFFFFSIKGCVSFTVGNEPALDPPPADPLVSGMVLADKFTRVVGEGTAALASLSSAHTAWIDTVPVLRFSHRVRSAIPSGTQGFTPSPSQGWASPEWSGTNRVRYLYELSNVRLSKVRTDGSLEAIDTHTWPAAWWMPAFRPAVPGPDATAASTHEGWDLALLRWEPSPWSRVHTEGGEGLDADPAENLGRICSPAPRPTRYCLLGGDGLRLTTDRLRLSGPPSGQSPYPPDFMVLATEGMPPTLTIAAMQGVGQTLGLGFTPGQPVALPAPFTPSGESVALTKAWKLPRLTRGGATALSLGLSGAFQPEVRSPQLLLALCLTLPDLGSKERVCLDMASLKEVRTEGRTITIGDVQLRDRGGRLQVVDNFPLGAPDGMPELAFSAKGLEILLPVATGRVELTVAALRERTIRVVAQDDSGQVVAQEGAAGQVGQVQTITVVGEGITRLRVLASKGTGHLLGLCYEVDSFTDEPRILERVLAMFGPVRPQSVEATASFTHAEPRLLLPRVVGTRGDQTVDWNGEIVGLQIDGRHGCLFISYQPKEPGPWQAFQIMAYPYFDLGLVRVCGVRHEALVAVEQDEARREEVQDDWNDAATGPAIARHMLLEPNTRYAVEVDYQVAVWVGATSTDIPPSASGLVFAGPLPAGVTVSGHQQRLYFRTAATGTMSAQQLGEFDKQGVFDPRALARYLRGFDPLAEEPSHLRRDPMLVWFEAEWIEDLLDRHGFELEVIVQRTDPPPKPDPVLAPLLLPAIIFPVLDLSWGPLPVEMRTLADQRMIAAAIEAPCLEDAPIEGATLQVTADLEPRARYDLVVNARPQGGGEVKEIGRSHFRASRYRDVTELIEATGFRFGEASPYLPAELLVSAAPPLDVKLGDDALLDAAMTTLGLDPLAPAVGPRSLLLWRQVGADWRLVGVLLDSDEALLRAPRLVHPTTNPDRLALPQIRVLGSAEVLTPVRSTMSATRVLFACAPIAVPADSELQLTVVEPSGTRTARRAIPSLPLIVLQERT